MMRLALSAMMVIALIHPATAQDKKCLDQWQAATDGGIVFGYGIIDGEPSVEVDEATWKSMAFETKVGMVAVLNCASFPAGKEYRVVNFISKASHNRVGRWESGKLKVYE